MTTTTDRVNLLDLAPCHKALEEELLAAAKKVITTQQFVLGADLMPAVEPRAPRGRGP